MSRLITPKITATHHAHFLPTRRAFATMAMMTRSVSTSVTDDVTCPDVSPNGPLPGSRSTTRSVAPIMIRPREGDHPGLAAGARAEPRLDAEQPLADEEADADGDRVRDVAEGPLEEHGDGHHEPQHRAHPQPPR